jgi:uncharacterized membrane protein YkgB
MEKFTSLGENISRFGLVAILLMFGVYKFTATEAEAIKPMALLGFCLWSTGEAYAKINSH